MTPQVMARTPHPPTYMAAVSLTLLLSRLLVSVIHKRKMKVVLEPTRSISVSEQRNDRSVFIKYVNKHGGNAIYTCKAVRAAFVAVLLVLTLVRPAGLDGSKQANAIQYATYVR